MSNVMKQLYFAGVLMFSAGLMAQNPVIEDSVILGPNYINKAFYSLANGEEGQMVNSDWDLQFASHTSMNSTIRLNSGFNVALWQFTNGDTTDWASLDTAGLGAATGWQRLYDETTAYESGAFEQNASGFPNYGWGTYNQVSHDVVGDQLFVMTTTNGAWKKVWIKGLFATTQSFVVRVADLDGQNDTEFTVDRSGQSSKNWLYYDIDGGQLINNEPDKTDYDLVFEKYEGLLAPGVYYPVTGVRLNRNVMGARVAGLPPNEADYNTVTLTDDITTIGHDWKSFGGMGFVLDDSVSYFVQDQTGDIWHLWFTGFVGAAEGKFIFNKQQIGSMSVANQEDAAPGLEVFPNPVSETLYVRLGAEKGNLQIVNLQGRVVYAQQFEGNQGMHLNLDVASLGLSAGLYVVQWESASGMLSQKFVVR
jgi:hypothetical protein